MTLVDLTQPLGERVPVGPGMPEPAFELRRVEASDLQRAGEHVRAGDWVLLRTGFWSHYDDPAAYRRHPYLADDAARWLVERAVRGIVLDTLSPDAPHHLRGEDFPFPVHHALLGAGVLIVENAALGPLDVPRCVLGVYPLLVRGGDGAQARVVAELDTGERGGPNGSAR